MLGGGPISQTCDESACAGSALAPYGRCLGHLDEPELDAQLAEFADSATLDARGVVVSAALLDRIGSCRPPDGGRSFAGVNFAAAGFDYSPDFNGASFSDHASFESTKFDRGANFANATFGAGASFIGATFGGVASFGGGVFGDRAVFVGATFEDVADFDGTTLGDRASFDDVSFSDHATFGGAVLGDDATFRDSIFADNAILVGASFGKDANFRGVTFGARARLRNTTFGARATFAGVTFGDFAGFEAATFGREATFDGAAFGDGPAFDGAVFSDRPSFDGVRFGDDASFAEAGFGSDATFGGATFGNDASFIGVTFGDRATFEGASFGERALLGPLGVAGSLNIQRLRCGRGGHLDVWCVVLDASDTSFPHGVTMRLEWGEVHLDRAEFGTASVIAARDRARHVDDSRRARRTTGPPREAQKPVPTTPRVITVNGTDLTHVTFNGLNLECCRFAGAYNLDGLRIEGPAPFARQPASRRWTRRRVVAEEHRWRGTYEPGRRRRGWSPPACRLLEEPALLDRSADRRGPAARAEAEAVEAVYRAVRKGLEEAKDEPGAADFYYGEMEMRRRAAPPLSVERALLFAYWAVAGYGLRASRAVAALVVVLALATVGFTTVGFDQTSQTIYQPVQGAAEAPPAYQPEQVPGARPGWRDALAYSVQSATSLLRSPAAEPLNAAGQAIEITVRLLGPLLLGLTILSVRGRVKR